MNTKNKCPSIDERIKNIYIYIYIHTYLHTHTHTHTYNGIFLSHKK